MEKMEEKEKTESFYHILGIQESADLEEIKRAYRKMSLKYHPDKNQGNPETVQMFHKVNEAYETLCNPERKQEYDIMRNHPFFKRQMGGMSMGGMSMGGMPMGVHIINLDDILGDIFGSGMPMDDFDPCIKKTFFQMGGMGGMPMGGMGGMPMGGMGGMGIERQNSFFKPAVVTKMLEVKMEQILEGCVLPIEIERTIIENNRKRNEKATVYVNVPQGIDDNEIILLPEEGNVHQSVKGDVKVFVKIVNDTEFTRQGLDLVYEKTISLKEALCGFSFSLKYINGKNYTIHNQKGNIVPSNFVKTIPKLGLAREGGNFKGNLIIHFKVDFPQTLTPEQIDTLASIL
jgi:DnaJ-class molecular chaperone